MSAEISDGDLVRLARDGDPAAFRLLVERHQPMVRARARRLCPNPSDVDDVVQESFLQAFVALDRLRDQDRFAGWLSGIVLNVCRGLQRRAPVTLLPDWPEPLHPASAAGLPSAEDLDRADAVRAAVAALPAGQRRAVALHYYADLPAGQAGELPGAARASLHKARLRLRAYITEHRPDLAPAVRRTHMTTVRVARTERRIPPGPVPIRFPTHVLVLADDAGRRELPIWLLGGDSFRFEPLAGPPAGGAGKARTADELTGRLLRAAGASVTAVDVDDLGPEVTAARIELGTPAGPQHVMARLPEGLALAITAGAPVRVADAVMDRLAVPASDDVRPGAVPRQTARDLRLDIRPRYEPRNMAFADGLARWELGGSFTEHASESHWHDYSSTPVQGTAVLSATVPQPGGFAFLGQEIFADDYRSAMVVFRGQFRVAGGAAGSGGKDGTDGTDGTDAAGADGASRAGLFLRVRRQVDIRGALTEAAVLADPNNYIATIAGGRDWASHEVTARIPDDTNTVVFGIFLAGPGQIELRDAELIPRA